jgi:predicted ester cyclase
MIINIQCDLSPLDKSVPKEIKMNELDIAKKLASYIERRDWDSARNLLSNDFTFSGPVPEPMNGAEWIGMHEKLGAAFPDWAFNLSDIRVEGDIVHATMHITGTHRGELDLSDLGLPKVAATQIKIKLPAEKVEAKIEGGKVRYLRVAAIPEAGIYGVLKQLGVAIPDRPMA